MKNKDKFRELKGWLFTSPWLVGFILLTIIPVLASVYISFTEWNILSPPKWVGLANYKEVFSDPLVFKSLKVTLFYCAILIPSGLILAFTMALLLNSDLKYASFFRTVYYLPSVVSGVATAVLFTYLFNHRFGLINLALAKIGIEGPSWLGDERFALWVLIFMGLWGVGGNLMLYLAGLQAVPQHLIDSAKIAGAGWWSRLFHIIIPSMSPIFLFAILTGLISGLQSFTSSYITTAGGPNNSTMFYALYLYNNAFVYRKMGKACAMAWILFVIIFVLSFLVLKASNKYVYYENDDGEII